MAKRNFKPQRATRKAKLNADNKKSSKVSEQTLPPDVFNHLSPTHNAFIGADQADTIENVIAGISLIKSFASLDTDMADQSTAFGMYWLSQNLIQALRFELKHRNKVAT